MKAMVDANGNLSDGNIPNETKHAAVDQMIKLFNERVARNRARAQAPAGSGAATPGVVKWGLDANGKPVRL